MARINVAEGNGRCTVSVRGEFLASDLRRLEPACARALAVEALPLEISLHAPPADEATRAFLRRREARGVIVCRPDVLAPAGPNGRHL